MERTTEGHPRMKTEQIKAIQARIGATPDGFWGRQSIAACQKYLRELMPTLTPWPDTSQAELTAFFGKAGDESQLVNLDVTSLRVMYEGFTVKTVRCNRKVAESLHRIFTALAKFPEGQAALGKYAGCYNNRPMRGGSLPSLHARGAAIDLDPDTNRNKQAWPASATMPLEVMECFAREGWLPAGAFWSRDAMHFQATQ
jgi:hypothetical protein